MSKPDDFEPANPLDAPHGGALVRSAKILRKETTPVYEIWLFIGFIAAWFILQAWILPKFGVST